MNIDTFVLASWAPRLLSFERYCEILRRVESGESLLDGPWVRDFPESSIILANRSFVELRQAREEIRALAARGVRILTPLDRDFPSDFFRMEIPPQRLFLRGHSGSFLKPRLAVVGSREPCSASVSWVEKEVGEFLRETDAVIVSGGARGIDQAAHRVALRSRRPTIVFLPSGLERLYPESLRDWIGPVLDQGGAFLSEYPMTTCIRRSHFVERNRLIAALASATLIVEAKVRSGTLLTAKAALALGRPLFVLPSHPYDHCARGGLDLICDGAPLVRDAQDLTSLFRSELAINEIRKCYPSTDSREIH